MNLQSLMSPESTLPRLILILAVLGLLALVLRKQNASSIKEQRSAHELRINAAEAAHRAAIEAWRTGGRVGDEPVKTVPRLKLKRIMWWIAIPLAILAVVMNITPNLLSDFNLSIAFSIVTLMVYWMISLTTILLGLKRVPGTHKWFAVIALGITMFTMLATLFSHMRVHAAMTGGSTVSAMGFLHNAALTLAVFVFVLLALTVLVHGMRLGFKKLRAVFTATP